MRHIRYFTKPDLIRAARIADEREYNRRVKTELLEKELDDFGKFPVVFSMIHEHRAGLPVDPHIRAMIMLDAKQRVLLDVDWDLYHALPVAEIEEANA
jgi:hypothetical protein